MDSIIEKLDRSGETVVEQTSDIQKQNDKFRAFIIQYFEK